MISHQMVEQSHSDLDLPVIFEEDLGRRNPSEVSELGFNRLVEIT